MLIVYPQSLTNADILGQGNLDLVGEKSGKSQGILLSIICGNPVVASLKQSHQSKTSYKYMIWHIDEKLAAPSE